MKYLAAITALVGITLTAARSLDLRTTSCSCQAKIAAVNSEIATIRSHLEADAAKIPLTALATRTFFVTPDEANAVTVPVNVGVTAETVRQELVLLATALNAGVPAGSDTYICNANGTVTSDFIQTDQIALPMSHVREIHYFDDSQCKISKIIGYVHGPLTVVTAGLDLTAVLKKLQAGEGVGQVLSGVGL